MLVEIDGQQYDVPDDATPQHIQQSLGLKAPEQEAQSMDDEYSFLDKPRQSFLNKLPRNIAAGGINALHGLANIPYDVAKFAEERNKNRKPEGYEANLRTMFGKPMAAQENPFKAEQFHVAPNFDSSKFVGIEGAPNQTDRAIQGLTEFAIPFGSGKVRMGARALGEAVPLFRALGAGKLNRANELAKTRDIGSLDIPEHLIEDLRQYMPDTAPYRNMIEKAKQGDYQSLFQLQSDAGKQAGGRANDYFSFAQRAHGRAGLEARGDLISKMKENLTSMGHEDVAKLFGKGQNDYRRYIKMKPYRDALGLALAYQAFPELKKLKSYLP